MSIKAISWALSVKTGSPATKLVLIKLADNANDLGRCWPSLRHISEQTELTERSIREQIRKLEKAGLVTTERRYADGVQLPNGYTLNLRQSVGVGNHIPGVGEPGAPGVGQDVPPNKPLSINRHLTEEGSGTLTRSEPRAPKATRWPSDAIVSEDWIQAAGMKRAERGLASIDLAYEAERFQNYWAAKGGQSATKVDWQKTWMNWATDKTKTGNGYVNGNGRKPTAHDKFLSAAASIIDDIDAGRTSFSEGKSSGGSVVAPRDKLLPS